MSGRSITHEAESGVKAPAKAGIGYKGEDDRCRYQHQAPIHGRCRIVSVLRDHYGDPISRHLADAMKGGKL